MAAEKAAALRAFAMRCLTSQPLTQACKQAEALKQLRAQLVVRQGGSQMRRQSMQPCASLLHTSACLLTY